MVEPKYFAHPAVDGNISVQVGSKQTGFYVDGKLVSLSAHAGIFAECLRLVKQGWQLLPS